MCQSCCQCNGLRSALRNLFGSPCGCNGSFGNAVNNLFGCGCGGNGGNNGCGCGGNGGNNGCGCGYDMYYAQQYALGPYSVGCNTGVCGY